MYYVYMLSDSHIDFSVVNIHRDRSIWVLSALQSQYDINFFSLWQMVLKQIISLQLQTDLLFLGYWYLECALSILHKPHLNPPLDTRFQGRTESICSEKIKICFLLIKRSDFLGLWPFWVGSWISVDIHQSELSSRPLLSDFVTSQGRQTYLRICVRIKHIMLNIINTLGLSRKRATWISALLINFRNCWQTLRQHCLELCAFAFTVCFVSYCLVKSPRQNTIIILLFKFFSSAL